jgi:transglutaminase-like putative cysteine protease
MKKVITFSTCFLFCSIISAQNFNAGLINDSLKKNANAVKRMEELKVVIKSESRATIYHKYAITILNEEGAAFADYQNSYDKLQTLENISGHLYDRTGKEIKSVKKKDIGDFSARDNISLMTDNRIKSHNFFFNDYPYTVEYEDEQELYGIFFLPSWNPVDDTKLAVEQSSFIVETPSDFKLRIKQIAYSTQPTEIAGGPKKTYSWKITNLPAVVYEPYQPKWSELNPAIYIAASTYEFEHYKGDMTTWLGLGKFINELNFNRQQLPENIKLDVHTLTDHIKTIPEKVSVLYNYLQKNTRYISVQLGIGGWQPFDANYVGTKKYGDCKALSNYMISLLKEAGIPAKYILIKAGENNKGLWENFPAPYFNHAIVCVPIQTDTLWLECTDQTVSPGYMGTFTGNRKALLIDDDGGHVVNTPSYKATDNLQIRKVDASIDKEGTLTANVFTHFTGIQQDEIHQLFHSANQEDKKKYLSSSLSLPTYSVEKFEYKEAKGLIPVMDETLIITSPNYATITGKRLFITPNFFNKSTNQLLENTNRKYDIEFTISYIDEDSIKIKIPDNYEVESIPKNVSLNNSFGKYSISFSVNNNSIVVYRRNERLAGKYPKETFATISNYFKEIYRADRGKIVMTIKE